MSEDKKIAVLDKGFVELQEMFGDEKTVVNCARVSFGKQVEVLEDRDIRLIRYLIRHKHQSPFRHLMFRFHIKAPEMVMRQWYKHVIGAEWSAGSYAPFHAWNEISGRYVVMEEIYQPDVWRRQSEDSKQGSGGVMDEQEDCAALYQDAVDHAMTVYHDLIERGVAKEEARLVLPLSLYTETIWTCSFQAVMNFLDLRLDSHAQWEIREYARVVQQLIQTAVPILYECWSDEISV